jgi:hypothetical protein
MASSLLYNIDPRLLAVLLFIGIILFYFLGLRVFQYQKKRNPAYEPKGIGAFEGAMLGLLSLLLAFTFNKSSSYYDTRRELLIHETNCIGTVLLRSDLFPDSVRKELRSDLKEYITERIHYFELGDDEKKIADALQRASMISGRIWNRAALIAQRDEVVIKSMQMIPAVNDMIDAVSSREEARKAHVPESILWLLFILCITGSFIVGYASKTKKVDWIILISYSLMTVMTVYIILDLDQPRHGIINTISTHQNMNELLHSFQGKVGENK